MSRGAVAVVGAGIAGLSAARRLREKGHPVRVFEKSRGLGGRCATRRSDGLSFDHGAQYFTVRERAFASAVASALEDGRVARWEPRIVRIRAGAARAQGKESVRYVGVPGMSSLGRSLAVDLDVVLDTRIAELKRAGSGDWELLSPAGRRFGGFGAVVVTCPAPQAADLVAGVSPELAAVCRAVNMQPCWAVLAAFEETLEVDFDAAFVDDEALAWAARDSSKPGRGGRPDCWTLHAGPEWSAARQDWDGDDVTRELLDRLFALGGATPRAPLQLTGHRWMYARSASPRTGDPLVDEKTSLGVAGDWARGDRIEGAFMSGLETADAIAALA